VARYEHLAFSYFERLRAIHVTVLSEVFPNLELRLVMST